MKKKILTLLILAISMVSCQDGLWNAVHDLEDKYTDLDGRVAKLEELCKEMNTNISSLQTIVSVILSNDYIVSVTPILKEGKEVGYTITFAIHPPITIYHGQDGADGKDGKDGQDGSTPIIGVAQDEVDHAYYWTLNGEWLLDANGNRIPLTSRDGINGQDGQDGKDGKDGKDGVNGITPQLKIEGGYWFVSTDNGTTWTQLGKAVGENGQDGAPGKDGKDGEDGDSMFSSVTYDEDFVYFELANGTILTVNKFKDDTVQIIDGTIMAEFSVSATKKVYFTQGNLMYSSAGTHQCADGTTKTGTWRFADYQWDLGDSLYWGDSGYLEDVHQNTYLSFFVNNLNQLAKNIAGTYLDWGKYNAIENGGNTPNKFRTLTVEEWDYLMNQRPNASKLKGQVYLYEKGERYSYILPDSWKYIDSQIPETLYISAQAFSNYPEWKVLEDAGAIIFANPNLQNHNTYFKSTGYRKVDNTDEPQYYNQRYSYYAGGCCIAERYTSITTKTWCVYPAYVRLVKDVE